MRPFVALGSPSETLLNLRSGYRPVGVVVGVSVVAKGNVTGQSGLNGAELRVQTDAVATGLANARRRAVEQALALGASGVVGMQVELLKNAAAHEALIEIRCVGTAVSGRETTDAPFLTNLHGADLVALFATGYRPVGLAVGFCFYTQASGYRSDNARQKATTVTALAARPYEHPDFTDATYAARGIAMGRLNADALAVGAEGVVGVELAPEIEKRTEALHISLVLIGTAIRQDRWSSTTLSKPAIVKSLKP